MTSRRPDTTRVWNFKTSFRDAAGGAQWTALPQVLKHSSAQLDFSLLSLDGATTHCLLTTAAFVCAQAFKEAGFLSAGFGEQMWHVDARTPIMHVQQSFSVVCYML